MGLTGKQRRFLRSLGHSLEPVLTVGRGGVTDAVVRQLDVDLEAHELVKVRFGKGFVDETGPAIETLARATGALEAGRVGKTTLLYRRRRDDPSIELPPA